MKWSIQELIRGNSIATGKGLPFRRRIRHIPFGIIKSIKLTIIWLFTGYHPYTYWGTTEVVIEEITNRYKQFLKNIKYTDGYSMNFINEVLGEDNSLNDTTRAILRIELVKRLKRIIELGERLINETDFRTYDKDEKEFFELVSKYNYMIND